MTILRLWHRSVCLFVHRAADSRNSTSFSPPVRNVFFNRIFLISQIELCYSYLFYGNICRTKQTPAPGTDSESTVKPNKMNVEKLPKGKKKI